MYSCFFKVIYNGVKILQQQIVHPRANVNVLPDKPALPERIHKLG